jgi:hypothetical protein
MMWLVRTTHGGGGMQAEMTVAPTTGTDTGRRGRAAAHRAVEVVAVALAVGSAWFLLALYGPEGWAATEVLAVLSAGSAVIFGASMSTRRGFVMSAVIAPAAIVGRALGERVTADLIEVLAFWMWFVVPVTIIVLAFWLIGVVIGWAWRRARPDGAGPSGS